MLTLIKRLVLGRKLKPSEMDKNWTDIENAFNGLEAELAVSLNPDGSLKANSVNTAAIQDRAVTLAKLAFVSNFYAVDAGAVNAMVISFVPPAAAYEAGMVFWVKAIASNTGASTLKVDSLAAVPVKVIKSSGLTDTVAGNILANGVYILVHDGTQFILLNPNVGDSSRPGPHYFPSPFVVYNGATVAWTTYDASLIGVPDGAIAVILQIVGRGGDNGAGADGTVLVEFRADSLSTTYVAHQTYSMAGDEVSTASQPTLPLAANRHFDYQVTTGGVGGGNAEIKLIGYYM